MAANEHVRPESGDATPLVPAEERDPAELTQENELLRYEVTHLRGRLAATEKSVRKLTRESTEQPEQQGSDGGARDDLVWLLQKLDRSPAGPLMRTRKGFRALREKYLGQGRA